MSLLSQISMHPAVMGLMQTLLYGGMSVILPLFIMDYSILDGITDRVHRVRPNEAYDFIVVGGGTTGAIVANRLSEDFTVLLLEAGGEPNPLQSIPGIAGVFLNSRELDWRYLTTSQKHSCLSLKDQKSLWPRGKALGGTGNLNFMVYIRGHPFDYDNWAYLTGDDRWNYKNLLPYFLRSENYNGPYNNDFHGHGGPLNIESDSFSPLNKFFLEAAQEMGYPRKDLNAPYSEAFSEFAFTKKRGRRWGSYQAFIQSVRRTRKNLTIRKYALVSRVLFKGTTNVAHGVEYEHHGKKYIAQAKNEVIISAGTIASPKILMQSGIGPQYHLSSLGIHPLVHSPSVGLNLQDHVIGFAGPFTIEAPLTFLIDRDTSPRHFLNFLQNGKGPLSASGIPACGLIASNFSKQHLNPPETIWPDLQLILFGLPVHKQGPALFSTLFHLRPEVAEKFYRPVAGRDSFHIMSIAARPKSRGKILLGSKNPREPPVIDPNYLAEDEDVQIIVEGMKKAVYMVENTKAFHSIGAKLSETPFPSCAHLEFRSDPYWECYVRQYSLSVYHPAGTCAMGKVGDPAAVVDSTLRVIGTERLRVIDASVMPQIISSNIQAACMAIGERGAQFIKDDWQLNSI